MLFLTVLLLLPAVVVVASEININVSEELKFNRLLKQSEEELLARAIKKIRATAIPGIEEVNLFKEDGKVIQFINPLL